VADDLIQGGETAYYRALIQQYDKQASKWTQRAKKIVKRYLDERAEGSVNQLRYNILWSNVETLKPAIYAQTPKPEVERRFLDKDPVGRLASQALERCLSYFMASTAFGSTMRQSRDDYLLVGRGIAWVRYVPTMRDLPQDVTETTTQVTDDIPQEVVYEDVLTDYVHWDDFGHEVGRTWEEVGVVWRKVYMTREQIKGRFSKSCPEWNEIPLDYVDKELKEAPGESGKKATIFEIWDKVKRKVFWVAKSWNKFIDIADDPLKLDYFFPCSRPIYATLANKTMIPVPDYAEYQDQAGEIDQITNRIGLLTKAIKAAGVYDASQIAVGRLLSEGVNNQLIPVDAWAAMAEKGGLKGTMELLPMKEIAETLLMLYEAREKVKQDLYEITGMSDIIRGATKASETATAQQIKSNFVTLRLSEKQREMQRFVRNTVAIMGNIIATHFSLETIKKISGLQLLTEAEKQAVQIQLSMQQAPQAMPPQGSAAMDGQVGQRPAAPQIPPEAQEMMSQPSWEQVYALLKDNPERSFRIDIETDSTVQADQQQEEEARMQFLQAVGSFLQQAESAAGNPIMMPLLGQMLAFGVRGFKIGRDLEGVIDETIEKLTKAAQNPPPAPPNPDMMKVQMDGQIAQMKMQQEGQLETQRMQNDMKIEAMKAEMKRQSDAADAQAKAQLALVTAHIEAQREDAKAQIEQQQQSQQAMMDAAFDRWKAELDARVKIEVAEIAAGATVTGQQIAAANDGAEGEAKPEPKDDHLEKLTALVSEIRKPRKVVRGGDGKIMGIE